MKWVFWLSAALVAYTTAGYPLLLYLRSVWRKRPVHRASIFPYVSIVTAVHNEADILPQKLRNLAQLDYPPDRYEVVIASDGSDDDSNAILESHANERLRVVVLSERRGKASALNHAIQAARGEIVVFTDARQVIALDAINKLAANFADPAVGCVSGELMLGKPDDDRSPVGVGLYWDLEKKIRQWESSTGSVIGATGALYAARKELLVPLPAGTILDDVYLPLHIARSGKRVVFEPAAHAYDQVASRQHEFRRKVRTLTGNYQLLQLAPWLLSLQNPVLFDYASHKLLRLWVPFALAGAFVSSLFLRGTLYQLALVLQVAFYASAGLAIFGSKLGLASRLAEASLAFLVLNTAAAVAFVYFVTGKRTVWVR